MVNTKYGDVIPTSKELAAASVELIGVDKREFVLKKALLLTLDCIFAPPRVTECRKDGLATASLLKKIKIKKLRLLLFFNI